MATIDLLGWGLANPFTKTKSQTTNTNHKLLRFAQSQNQVVQPEHGGRFSRGLKKIRLASNKKQMEDREARLIEQVREHNRRLPERRNNNWNQPYPYSPGPGSPAYPWMSYPSSHVPSTQSHPVRRKLSTAEIDAQNRNFQARSIQTAALHGIDYGTVLGWGVPKFVKKIGRGIAKVPMTAARMTVNAAKDVGNQAQRASSVVKNVATGDFSKAGRQAGRMGKAVTVNLATNVVKSGVHLGLQAGRGVRDVAVGLYQGATEGANIAKRILRRAFRMIIRKGLGKQALSGAYFEGDIVLGADEINPQMEQSILTTGLQALGAAGRADPGSKRGIIKAICMGAATAIIALTGQEYLLPFVGFVAGAAFDLAWKDENADSQTYSEMAQEPGIQPNSDGATTVPSYDAPQSNVSMPSSSVPGLYPSETQYQEPSQTQSGTGTALAIGGAALVAMLAL